MGTEHYGVIEEYSGEVEAEDETEVEAETEVEGEVETEVVDTVQNGLSVIDLELMID